MAKDLFLEVGVEEIPSHYLPQTLEQMQALATDLLNEQRLTAKTVKSLATPRRIVLFAGGVPERQAPRRREIQGPPKAAGFDAKGRPTPAALGFARTHGLSAGALSVKRTERGEYLFAIVRDEERETRELLKELLPRFLSGLSFPKSMRWGAGEQFVRPLRWIVALYGRSVVPFRFAGLRSGNQSMGHPLMSPSRFTVRDFGSYLKETRRRRVIVDPALRRDIIAQQVGRLARSHKGVAVPDPYLIEQNAFMTEFPVGLCGKFDPSFLDLPAEVLINVMREQQGYFAVHKAKGGLQPNFICIVDLKLDRMEQILHGHERVLRARFEDARFYFEEDQRLRLAERVEALKGVVYHDRLGTLHEKMERLVALGSYLCERLQPDSLPLFRRAAALCKADLLTGMVREFPELQGVIGREYSRRQGEPEQVSRAIFEHYLPRSGNDSQMPKTDLSKFLAVADKLDAISGFFGIGLQPKGSEDPFGIRRHGQGLIRLLMDELFLCVSLEELIGFSVSLYKDRLRAKAAQTRDSVRVFLRERMQSFLRGRALDSRAGRGRQESVWFRRGAYCSDLVDAVLIHRFDNVAESYRRIVSLVSFQGRPEFEPLMIVYKRAARIVPPDLSVGVRPDLFKESSEEDLFNACRTAAGRVDPLLEQQRYEEFLEVLAGLRKPIDNFFNRVFVMDEDSEIRMNRLALLKGVCDLFQKYADFSQVVVETGG